MHHNRFLTSRAAATAPALPLLLQRLSAPHEPGQSGRADNLPGMTSTGVPAPDSARQMRHSVLANLDSLLNCTHYAAGQDLTPWPQVAGSVLNFGLPALAGKLLSDLVWHDLEQALRLAISRFEPRIDGDSLHITGLATPACDADQRLSFDIRGQLHYPGDALPFLFRSKLDLASGHVELCDAG